MSKTDKMFERDVFLRYFDKNCSINSLTELLEEVPVNDVIGDNLVKAWSFINRPNYKSITCSISGGSDSDIMLDICCRCDKDKKIKYVYFDTGIEYKATKEHIKYLEDRYGIKIETFQAWKYGKCIPTSCKQYGQPFLSKQVSEFIQRLQSHGFQWEDESIDVLMEKYPNCKSALDWWCGEKGTGSQFNITQNKWLKEFIIQNPPDFKISNKCCKYAKKDIAHYVEKLYKADLSIYGVRKAEGGVRATSYKNCFSDNCGEKDQYRPIFWYSDSDKKCYEEFYGIKHSDCYEKYGLKRTGCIGCPFGKNLEYELDVARQYEPNVYKAICNIFKDSYEYTRKYKEFVKMKNSEEKDNGQVSLFDYMKEIQ